MHKPNSKFTKKIFREIVKGWYENHKNTPEWDHYASKGSKFIREKILDRGRADFNQVFKDSSKPLELNQDDRVILYCYYYMQFHYTSSWYTYFSIKKILKANFINDKQLIFIDIGCGPFTSGLAFLEFYKRLKKKKKLNLVYLGVDISKAMIKRSKILINTLETDKKNRSFHFGKDYKSIPKKLKKILKENGGKKTNQSVVINLSYFLAAHNLEITKLIETFEKIFKKFKHNNICLIYQNPPYPSLHRNWKKIKHHFKKFRNFKKFPTKLSVEFDDEMGSWLPRRRPNRIVHTDFLYTIKKKKK